jgi:hypothetical protein
MKARLVAFRSVYFNPATVWVMGIDFPGAQTLCDRTHGLRV